MWSSMTIKTACSGCAWRAGLSRRRKKGASIPTARRGDQDGNLPRRAADRRVPDQRGRKGRSGVVDARAMVLAHRPRDDGHTVTIAIFDHPGESGYPTYWHARGYGLFAANPLGSTCSTPKQNAAQLHDREGTDGDLPLSHRVLHARSDGGRAEPRSGRVRRRENRRGLRLALGVRILGLRRGTLDLLLSGYRFSRCRMRSRFLSACCCCRFGFCRRWPGGSAAARNHGHLPPGRLHL